MHQLVPWDSTTSNLYIMRLCRDPQVYNRGAKPDEKRILRPLWRQTDSSKSSKSHIFRYQKNSNGHISTTENPSSTFQMSRWYYIHHPIVVDTETVPQTPANTLTELPNVRYTSNYTLFIQAPELGHLYHFLHLSPTLWDHSRRWYTYRSVFVTVIITVRAWENVCLTVIHHFAPGWFAQ